MQVLDQIAAERRQVADLVEGLDQDQLQTPSLCGAWSVRDVAAHLLMPLVTGRRHVLGALLRSGGSFDRANVELALRTARRSDPDIVHGLRANARHPFRPPTLPHDAPLTDLLIHTQDMRRPLGLHYRPPDESLRTALAFLTSRPSVIGFVRKGTREGLRFEATDLDWSSGDGLVVRGPATPLLLALTGRAAAFDELEGDGRATLRARVRAD